MKFQKFLINCKLNYCFLMLLFCSYKLSFHDTVASRADLAPSDRSEIGINPVECFRLTCKEILEDDPNDWYHTNANDYDVEACHSTEGEPLIFLVFSPFLLLREKIPRTNVVYSNNDTAEGNYWTHNL